MADANHCVLPLDSRTPLMLVSRQRQQGAIRYAITALVVVTYVSASDDIPFSIAVVILIV